MGLDSIYAMLARPVQALYNRKRNVSKVSLTDDIHPDSHESPQSQLPPNADTHQEARIKPNLIKAKEKTSTNSGNIDATTGGAPHIEMQSIEKTSVVIAGVEISNDDTADANSADAHNKTASDDTDIVLPNGEHIKHIDIEV
ncbi:hypothetical protein [Shewanella sp.]|uniref:hypothetical protein n=1 Tax=Shewanella sp. TaxID=50422 RepID=UPI004053B002